MLTSKAHSERLSQLPSPNRPWWRYFPKIMTKVEEGLELGPIGPESERREEGGQEEESEEGAIAQ